MVLYGNNISINVGRKRRVTPQAAGCYQVIIDSIEFILIIFVLISLSLNVYHPKEFIFILEMKNIFVNIQGQNLTIS